MTQKQAIDILVQTAKLAQKGGILTLEDAAVVLEAIKAAQVEDKPVVETVEAEVE